MKSGYYYYYYRICLPFRLSHACNHSAPTGRILIQFEDFSKIREDIQVYLNSDNNNWYFI